MSGAAPGTRYFIVGLQVNARKIYDEPNVLEGIFTNRLFLGILGAEAALQVRSPSSQMALYLNAKTDPFTICKESCIRTIMSRDICRDPVISKCACTDASRSCLLEASSNHHFSL